MPAARFFFFNITGGICWAGLFGFGAYAVGTEIFKISEPLSLASLGLFIAAGSALSNRDKAAKKHDSGSIAKKQISTDQQSVFIKMNVSPVFAKKRQSEAAPNHVSDPVSDDRTDSRRGYNESDVDLIGGGGQESSSNKDSLSGKGHAGAFQRDNDGDDPRSMGLDQANQIT